MTTNAAGFNSNDGTQGRPFWQGLDKRSGGRWAGLAMAALVTLSLISGCSGNDDDAAASTEVSATIGAAGGTLEGPDGVRVEIPAGALTQNTLIRIARSSSGAPATLPAGIAAAPTYEITPHGLEFDLPVTISLPTPAGDPALLQVFTASPGDTLWRSVGSGSDGGRTGWQVTGFSWYLLAACAPNPNDPYSCVWPTSSGSLTATPSSALSFDGVSSSYEQVRTYRLTAAGTVNFKFSYSGAADCTATVGIVRGRTDVRDANGRIIVSSVLPVQAATSAVDSGNPKRRRGETPPLPIAFTSSDNGEHLFGLTYTCARPSGPAQSVGGILRLIVNVPAVAAVAPAVTTQPAAVSVQEPATATFSVVGTGTPTPTVQWQRSGNGGASWADITSATSLSYTTAATSASSDNGSQFRAVLTNSAGQVTSQSAVLTVTAPAAGLLQTTLASATSTGGVPDNFSSNPSLSSNGRRIAFTTSATNVVAGGAASGSFGSVALNAYVHDLDAGTTELVNRALAGAVSSFGTGENVRISGNGRYVIFTSSDPLVPDDTNRTGDVFVRDLQAGSNVRLNVLPSGAQMLNNVNLNNTPVDISDDGRFALFQYGNDLTGTGSSLGFLRWFVRDLTLATTSAIPAFDNSTFGAALSGDGQRVAVRDFQAQVHRIRMFDPVLGVRTVLSIPSSDGDIRGRPTLSRDGRYVAFEFRSASLLGGAAASVTQIGVIDMQASDPASTIELASRTASGTPGDGRSRDPQLSADGRYVVFTSQAASLSGGVTSGGSYAVLVRDRAGNTTFTASRNVAGDALPDAGSNPAISGDGATVAFSADIALVLLGGGPLGNQQIFVAPRP